MLSSKNENSPSYDVTTQPKLGSDKTDRKWLYGVVFYAGAVTAALITVSVLGSLHLDSVKANCIPQDENYHGQLTDGRHNEKVYHLDDGHTMCNLDLHADKQILSLTGAQYGENTLMVVDFKKGLCGIYDGANDACYLLGGLDAHLPNTTMLDQILSGKVNVSDPNLHYHVIMDRPVTNQALLPEDLYVYCWGKPVYWLERSHAQHGTRTKRDKEKSDICIGVSWGDTCVGVRIRRGIEAESK